ncbi:NUDIX hydrolase [Tepidiforma flava]|uniref:NUDIX hydrolase n=1 Tax=Tepidiforma flava TaxID=3004094 RepID=A0ABY7M9H6_9CHLR|nr:NUDIX hydrolase [Tepidiforma flava]WBL37201.1 NUDIX hydrolase [Tepidiforma flava]
MPYKAPGSGREGSAVFLVAPDGSILLQQRDDDVPPAGIGRWTPPGGGREPGESPLETARREFEEETGVRLQRLRYIETVTTAQVPDLLPSCLHLFVADDPVPRAAIEVREGLDFQYHHPSAFDALPMNPGTRQLLARFTASDAYRGTVGMLQPFRVGVGVIALDRWGRALLQLRDADLPPERFPGLWSIPGGLVEPDEPPDAAAFREFEEETGVLLDDLRLFRVYRASELPGSLTHVYHIYYGDPDVPEELIEVREGQAFRYWAPREVDALPLAGPAASVLRDFFASTHYRKLFH